MRQRDEQRESERDRERERNVATTAAAAEKEGSQAPKDIGNYAVHTYM